MSNTVDTIEIDGSVLEGGGQLVRNAVTFSTLLSRPISIINIRANRKPNGLKPQHVAGIKLAAEICNGNVTGLEKGSREIHFYPGQRPKPADYLADPGTAGSTTLLLQVSLPCLLFVSGPPSPSPSTLTLLGGTNATSAPQIDYTSEVFLPFLRRHFALDPALALTIAQRGYFPRGGGRVVLSLPPPPRPPRALPAVVLTARGAVTAVHGRAFVAGALPPHLARRLADAAAARLVAAGLDPACLHIRAVREDVSPAAGSGSGIVLWAETEHGCVIGGSAVGAKGTDAAKTGEAAAEELARNLDHGGCVDEYLQDQIIIFMALAKGKSTVATGPLTLHTKTAIWLAEKLTDAKFHIEEEPGTTRTLITCEGIALEPNDE